MFDYLSLADIKILNPIISVTYLFPSRFRIVVALSSSSLSTSVRSTKTPRDRSMRIIYGLPIHLVFLSKMSGMFKQEAGAKHLPREENENERH